MSSLGQTIRAIRKRKGLTMRAFGDVYGLTQSAISQYESGKIQPDSGFLLAIYKQAEGSLEKGQIMRALGMAASATARLSRGDLIETIDRLGEYLEDMDVSDDQVARGIDPRRAILYEVAKIINEDSLIDARLAGILRTWRMNADAPGFRDAFDSAMRYLEVWLATQTGAAVKTPEREVAFQVWMQCPQTKKHFWTGSIADSSEAFAASGDEFRQASCPHCHSSHRWNRHNAYLRLSQ